MIIIRINCRSSFSLQFLYQVEEGRTPSVLILAAATGELVFKGQVTVVALEIDGQDWRFFLGWCCFMSIYIKLYNTAIINQYKMISLAEPELGSSLLLNKLGWVV